MNTRFLADLPGIHERSAAVEGVVWRLAFVGWILMIHCSCSCYQDPLHGTYFEGPSRNFLAVYFLATSFQMSIPCLRQEIRIEEHLLFLWIGYW